MADALSQDHRELLKQVAANEGITDFSLDVKDVSSRGENLMGVIKLVSIKDKNDNRRLDLVLKVAQTNKNFRRISSIEEMYKREAIMYNKLLPGLAAFQNERNVSTPLVNYPKVYGSYLNNGNECIVLKNVTTNNEYRLWDRKKPINEDHILAVFSAYAKFHAISLAFRKLQPEKFEEQTREIKESVLKKQYMDVDGWTKNINSQCQEIIELLGDNQKARNCIERFQQQVKKLIYLDTSNEKYALVVLHGDSWCNNVMFKYQDQENPEKPTDVCILDWQLSTLGSPIRDLIYFMCLTCRKEDLDKVDVYLNIYYDVLSESLRNFGCDPDEVFPRSLLDEHWKVFAKFGLYIAIVLLKLFFANSEEIPDLEKAAGEGQDMLTAFGSTKYSDVDNYKKRIADVVTFFDERNLV